MIEERDAEPDCWDELYAEHVRLGFCGMTNPAWHPDLLKRAIARVGKESKDSLKQDDADAMVC